MYIEKFSNNGLDCLRLSENYRPEGSARPKRRIILNLGPLSKLDDGQPDFLGRLRESFRNGTPILEELLPYVSSSIKQEEVKTVLLPFPVNGDSPDGEFIEKRFADVILNAYMEELGLSQLFRLIKSRSKFEYDLLGFVKLSVYGRILEPASKIATVNQNNKYYTPIIKEPFNENRIYNMLDVVYENRLPIFQTIDRALRKRKQGRNTSMVFYDVSNFYFEIEKNDEDILDDDGVVIEEGLRKLGHSKESRSQPIVQMGLFMDRDGVPIGIKSFPGNNVDKSTMINAVREIITPMGYERYIYCADRGLCTLANLAFLVKEGMGYLLSKSIKQSKKEDREWILKAEGYVEEKDAKGNVIFKYKHDIKERKYTNEDGTEVIFNEKVVVFWSREYYEREKHMMENFSKFLTDLENSTKSFTLNSSQTKNIRRFLKDAILVGLDPENDPPAVPEQQPVPESDENVPTTSDGATPDNSKEMPKTETSEKPKRKRLTQEEKDQRAAEKKAEAARNKALKESRNKRLMEQLKDSETAKAMIDWDKVNRWRDYAGYYQIVTSELTMEDLDVINAYRGLTQIENRFRTMKGTLDTRPIFLRTPEHIKAHLILCTVSLILMALIQCKLKEKEVLPEGKKWFLGLEPDRIQNALNAFLVEPFPDDYFRFRSRSMDQEGRDLQKILDAYPLNIEHRLYTRGQLRALRGSVKVL